MKEIIKELIVNVQGGNFTEEDKSDILELLERSFNNCINYVVAVNRMEVRIPFLRATCEGEDLREKIMNLDSKRRSAHEAAIVGARVINRYAAMFEMSAPFKGDVENRYEVADFCFLVVEDLFENREGARPINFKKAGGL